MSLYVMFHGADDGDDGPFQLASASGWAAFAKWVDSLGHYPLLKKFTDEGSVDDSEELSNQLGEALTYFPPGNDDVKDTAGQLLDKLGDGDGKESVTVLNEDLED